MKYFDELKRTMEWVAQQPKTFFLGQTVAGPGTFMYQTLIFLAGNPFTFYNRSIFTSQVLSLNVM